jgi:histidinol phosphatase-like PHP family hydrolase
MKKKFAILPPDYHTHTALCKHAEGQPADYVRLAVQKGLREIAVTDHGPAPHYFELIGEMADTKLYDVVTHLDLPKRGGNRPRDRYLPNFVLPALDRIARAGMAIEINTSGLRHPVNEMYPAPRILAWAQEREIPITFGSDAHLPEQVASNFEQAVALAHEAGYTHGVRFRQRQRRKVSLPEKTTIQDNTKNP